MNTNQIAHIAQLVGEPARTSMLVALLDGRALTAHELAGAGRITPATASRHLALLVEAGLLRMERQGRHRYHRLASPEVARLLEGLMQLASQQTAPALRTGPRDAALRRARRCYDHIAGRLAVAITEHLEASGAIVFEGEAGHVTSRAPGVLAAVGIDLTAALAGPATRPDCRPCLDWGERRMHVAGRLGALLCNHSLERGWLRRRADSRVLDVTPAGAAAYRGWLGLARWQACALEPDA